MVGGSGGRLGPSAERPACRVRPPSPRGDRAHHQGGGAFARSAWRTSTLTCVPIGTSAARTGSPPARPPPGARTGARRRPRPGSRTPATSVLPADADVTGDRPALVLGQLVGRPAWPAPPAGPPPRPPRPARAGGARPGPPATPSPGPRPGTGDRGQRKGRDHDAVVTTHDDILPARPGTGARRSCEHCPPEQGCRTRVRRTLPGTHRRGASKAAALPRCRRGGAAALSDPHLDQHAGPAPARSPRPR